MLQRPRIGPLPTLPRCCRRKVVDGGVQTLHTVSVNNTHTLDGCRSSANRASWMDHGRCPGHIRVFLSKPLYRVTKLRDVGFANTILCARSVFALNDQIMRNREGPEIVRTLSKLVFGAMTSDADESRKCVDRCLKDGDVRHDLIDQPGSKLLFVAPPKEANPKWVWISWRCRRAVLPF